MFIQKDSAVQLSSQFLEDGMLLNLVLICCWNTEVTRRLANLQSFPKGLNPLGQQGESRPLASSNIGSSWFTDSLWNLANLIGWYYKTSTLLMLKTRVWPEVLMFGADQKDHGTWKREWLTMYRGRPQAKNFISSPASSWMFKMAVREDPSK